MAGEIIAPLLTNMYNNCNKTGSYPQILKIAQIIPIDLYKNGAKNCAIIIDPFLFSVHFLKSLRNVSMSNYIFILKSLTLKYLQIINLALNKNVAHLMQSDYYQYMMKSVTILIK